MSHDKFNRIHECYKQVRQEDLKRKYETRRTDKSWYHLFFGLGALALIVGFFLIFG